MAQADPAAPLGAERAVVLVVDDSPDALRLMRDTLEAAGATVLVALGGEQALGVADEITPDVVLMDALMPGMDGFETTRRLKGDPALRHVPVIFMTGLTETEHVVRGLEAGGVDYVAKPIVPDEIVARIRVHLANARAAQSAREALDTAGRTLFAASRDGRVLWCTPQAARLLADALPAGADGALALPPAALRWLGEAGEAPAPGGALPAGTLPALADGTPLELSFLGRLGEDEHLFRLAADRSGDETPRLRERFALTGREAEVLLWLARGKSNRDIAAILELSPRTVNKHLETVFGKLGVENRASATFLVMKTLGGG